MEELFAEIPRGLCQCGCGQSTPIATRDRYNKKQIKGLPRAFAPSHKRPDNGHNYKMNEKGCWVWQGCLVNGYGRSVRHRKPVAMHRWYYEQLVGPIPEGLELDHLCRNRACVNPEHLEPVTPYVNQMRRPYVRLNPEKAREIRALQGKERGRAVAKKYGVSDSVIYGIWHGHSWKETI